MQKSPLQLGGYLYTRDIYFQILLYVPFSWPYFDLISSVFQRQKNPPPRHRWWAYVSGCFRTCLCRRKSSHIWKKAGIREISWSDTARIRFCESPRWQAKYRCCSSWSLGVKVRWFSLRKYLYNDKYSQSFDQKHRYRVWYRESVFSFSLWKRGKRTIFIEWWGISDRSFGSRARRDSSSDDQKSPIVRTCSQSSISQFFDIGKWRRAPTCFQDAGGNVSWQKNISRTWSLRYRNRGRAAIRCSTYPWDTQEKRSKLLTYRSCKCLYIPRSQLCKYSLQDYRKTRWIYGTVTGTAGFFKTSKWSQSWL